MPAIRSLHMTLPDLSRQPPGWQDQVLGAICFSTISTPFSPTDTGSMPLVQVPARMLDAAELACEVWLSDAKLQQGQFSGIRYRHDGATLFGMIALAEAAQTVHDSAASPLQQAAEHAYRQIFALLDQLDYPCMYRFWNYMADINAVSHGLERYRQFNVGRQNAFLACNREVTGQLPAACALGMAQGPLTVAFLAGRTPSHAIENPRQVSAYQYPQQYGPRSPTFSRANLLQQAGPRMLLISGTASIVGHETLHPADAVAQTQESLANIRAVINEANGLLDQPVFDPACVFYRVYVRHAADLPSVRQELLRALGADLHAAFVQADICRADLLVEIEATATAAHTAGHRR